MAEHFFLDRDQSAFIFYFVLFLFFPWALSRSGETFWRSISGGAFLIIEVEFLIILALFMIWVGVFDDHNHTFHYKGAFFDRRPILIVPLYFSWAFYSSLLVNRPFQLPRSRFVQPYFYFLVKHFLLFRGSQDQDQTFKDQVTLFHSHFQKSKSTP